MLLTNVDRLDEAKDADSLILSFGHRGQLFTEHLDRLDRSIFGATLDSHGSMWKSFANCIADEKVDIAVIMTLDIRCT